MLCNLWCTNCHSQLRRWRWKTRRTHTDWARWLWREFVHPPANLLTTRGLYCSRQFRHCVVKPSLPPPTSHTLDDKHPDGSEAILRRGMRLFKRLEAIFTWQVGGKLEALYFLCLLCIWLAKRSQPPSSEPALWPRDGSSRAHGQARASGLVEGKAQATTPYGHTHSDPAGSNLGCAVMGMFVAWHIFRAAAALCWRRRAVVYWLTRLLFWSASAALRAIVILSASFCTTTQGTRRRRSAAQFSARVRCCKTILRRKKREQPSWTITARGRCCTAKRSDRHFSCTGGVSSSCLLDECCAKTGYLTSMEMAYAMYPQYGPRPRAAYGADLEEHRGVTASAASPRGRTARRRRYAHTWLALTALLTLCILGYLSGAHTVGVWRPYSPYAGVIVGQAAVPGPDFDFSEIDKAISEERGEESETEEPNDLDAQHHNDEGPSRDSCSGAERTGSGTWIPSWDWGFNPLDLLSWRAAEAESKCTIRVSSSPSKRNRIAKKTKDASAATPSGDFMAASAHSGSHKGYSFRTGAKGTGYYMDKEQAPDGPPTTSAHASPRAEVTPHGSKRHHPAGGSLRDAVFCHADQEGDRTATGPGTGSVAARRARAASGARRKRTSRFAKLAALLTTPFIAATGQLADKDWKDLGLWALDTANANCLETAKEKVLSKSAADFQFLQETKVRTAEEAKAAQRQLRQTGWSAHFPLARTTEAGRGSGGCAVAAKKGTGISPVDPKLIAPDMRHRLAAYHVSGVIPGGLHLISVYLKDSEGLSEYNLKILQEAAALVLTLGTPWVMAGDWNVNPQRLQQANWLGIVKGTVVATELPTCNDNTYDYFVVSQSLNHADAGVQRLDDAGLQPHFPCQLFLRGNARRHAVRKLCRAPRVPAVLPHGPAQKPPDYSSILSMSGTVKEVSVAMNKWYSLARSEWAHLAGTNLRHKQYKFCWDSAVGPRKVSGSTALAAAWREVARRSEDAAKISKAVEAKAASKAQLAALHNHNKALDAISEKLPAGVPPELKRELSSWVVHCRKMAALECERPKRSLVKLADLKAKKFKN